jgi:uncharacterized protein (TIGR03790 family)
LHIERDAAACRLAFCRLCHLGWKVPSGFDMRVGQPTLQLVACFALLACCCSEAQAIDPSGVLVLYNSNDQDSFEIATEYKRVHGLAESQLLGLNLGSATTITANDYLTNIRPAVLSALTPATDLIVTTKGMPLKIQVQAPNPSTYTDPYGNVRQVVFWKPNSSLESELAKIDYIASEQMMGDQSLGTFPPFDTHFTKNLYYQSTAPFSHSNFTGQYEMRLTARLDGFTKDDVLLALNKAQNAFVGPNNTPGGPFHFLVDADPTKGYAPTMTNLAENVLPAAGLPLTYDNTTAFQGTAGGKVLGYTSHGANQASTPPSTPGVGSYIVTSLDIDLADGAVFNSWESYNAQSFQFGDNWGNQGLVAEWLAKGGTAGVGNVAEPGASPFFVSNEDLLFARLLEGRTFAEAAWSSMRQLSYVNTIVGDPLMTWKVLLAGDVNMDGLVDMNDLGAMGPHWGTVVDPGGYGWTMGDLNGDGIIDMGDIGLVSSTWGETSDWSEGALNLSAPPSPMAEALFASMHHNPEPSTLALLGIGASALVVFGWRRRRARGRLIWPASKAQ